MMSFKKKIKRWAEKKQVDAEKGREITLQMQAERLRRKQHRLENMNPSSVKTLLTGMQTGASPISVMKEEYSRRKYERKNRK